MSDAPAAATYVLPPALITRADLARIVREVESIDVELEAQKARAHTTGKATHHMPSMSQGLSDFAEMNKVDVADDQARMHLKEDLRRLKDKAPVMHMTFASPTDPQSLQQLVDWIRKEIHPQALLQVGLQPALVGGVYLRTPNHVHDFSLRQLLADKRSVIVNALDLALHAVPVAAAPAQPAVPVTPAAPATPVSGGAQ